MNRQNGFANFFVFAKIFDRKVQKLNVLIFVDNADMHFFFRYGGFHIFKSLIPYLFLPDYSFKICEKPSEFFHKCLCSYGRVYIVNNYSDNVSA